ncbi:MAG: hypothetical protein MUC88_26685, partial [Planctomycetes bacterium]|nr:hypothetical protein [Planctomycetota bacterium]
VSRLSPAVLFETAADGISLPGDVVPKYLAFVSSGQTRVHAVAQLNATLELDEPWVLMWFGDRAPARAHVLPHDVEDEKGVAKGPDGYDRAPDAVDLPVLIRLEHKVRSVRADAGKGLVFEFAGPVGKMAIMPVAGGRLFLPQETEPWAQNLPEEIVAQCRGWSARLGCLPLSVRESAAADLDAGTVTVRQRFAWAQFEDGWGTKAIKAAPVPPMLALALGRGLPIRFTSAGQPVQPVDYGLMDTAGLAMGIEGVDEYEYTIGGLKDLVAVPAATGFSQDASAQGLQTKLEDHVRQMVEAGHLAPLLYIYGGIGGTWFSHCYWGTGTELAQAVAAAYPYLSESLRAKTLDSLRSEWKANPPFQVDQRRYFNGQSRTPYEMPWRDMDRHASYAVGREAEYRVSDHLFALYGVDAYLRLTSSTTTCRVRPRTTAGWPARSGRRAWPVGTAGPGSRSELGVCWRNCRSHAWRRPATSPRCTVMASSVANLTATTGRCCTSTRVVPSSAGGRWRSAYIRIRRHRCSTTWSRKSAGCWAAARRRNAGRI